MLFRSRSAVRKLNTNRMENVMDFGLGILTFGTIGSVLAFAYLNIRALEKRREQNMPKSSLAIDGDRRSSALVSE